MRLWCRAGRVSNSRDLPPAVHFWIPSEPPHELATWDPDLQPELFATGLGHAVYELYARVRDRGIRVTIGPRPAADARVVVAFAKSLTDPAVLKLVTRRLRLIVIMSDADHETPLPVRACVRVVARPGLVQSKFDRWLPLLPQRGLVPNASTGLRSVAYLGRSENAPPWLTTPAFAQGVAELGLELRLAIPEDDPEGRSPTWHDFSDSDIVLCLRARRRSDRFRPEHKPPTKLINAWCAGSVPIVGSEPAYLDLVHDDALVLGEVDETAVVAALGRLVTSPETVSRLRDAGRRRAAEFATDRVLEQWLQIVDQVAEERARLLIQPAGIVALSRTWAGKVWRRVSSS